MANTVVENLNYILREELAPGVRESLPAVDGIFERIKSSSMGVQRDTGVGRGYYVKHNFVASVGGAYKFRANPYGSTTRAMGASGAYGPVRVLDTINTFPGAKESANVGIIQRQLQLVAGAGNFFLPIQVFQTDQLDASTAKYVSLNIQQTARMVAQLNAVSFYAVSPSGTTLQPLAQIESVEAGGGDGDGSVTVGLDGSTYNIGRIRNFYPGMFVDILDYSDSWASLTDTASNCYLVVTEVDYFNQTVKIASTTGTDADFTAQVEARDVIVPKDNASTSTGYGPSGLESWMKATGQGADTTVFGIDIDTSGTADFVYPQFGSMVESIGGPLTENLLNKYVGSFYDAMGKKLDSILTTGGVVREFLDQVADLGVYQRQGQALKYKGGWTDVGYAYNGQNFDWLISTYVSPGRLYVTKTGDRNLTRYVPPKIPGAASNAAFSEEVQFIAQLGGSSGIFKLLTDGDTGSTTEVVEAPFMTLHEIAPMDVQGIKLTGLTESNA